MRRWNIWYGRWWMIQYALDWTFSLGVHLDPVRRGHGRYAYGPYMDLHAGPFAVSLGNHPARAWNHSLTRPEVLLHGRGH